MAKFTTTDDKTDVTAIVMHVGVGKGAEGHKSLHLAGVDEKDKKNLTLVSSNDKITVGTPSLFKDKGGIWTVRFTATAKGNATITAKVGATVVATLAITAVDALVLPNQDTPEGMLVRLFIAEVASPDSKMKAKWTEADAKKSMQWMRLVLKNRLNNNPTQFMAKGATTTKDIVKAKDKGIIQYHGFSDYPTIDADITQRIAKTFEIANDDGHGRQTKYAAFIQAALDVAASKTEIHDPCGDKYFLSGWMTLGHDPKDNSVAFQPLLNEQFFMMKR